METGTFSSALKTGLLALACWLGSLCTVYAQNPDSLLTQADRFLAWRAYGRSIELYTDLLAGTFGPLNLVRTGQAQVSLARAYQAVGDGAKAEQTMRTFVQKQAKLTAEQALLFAQILGNNGKLADSQRVYTNYLSLKDEQRSHTVTAVPPGPVVLAGGNRNAKPARYRLEYLDFNTNLDEFSPTFYRDGLVYVAGGKGGKIIETIGKGGGEGYLDLLYLPDRSKLLATKTIDSDGIETQQPVVKTRPDRSSRDQNRNTANDSPTVGRFSVGGSTTPVAPNGEPINPAKEFSRSLNTRYHEGPATFTPDFSQIIFTRNNFDGKVAGKSVEGVNKLKLYQADQQNGTFSEAVELPFNSDNYSVGHPSLSVDNKRLYFASDMPGGFGGTDIYVVYRTPTGWTKPANLGTPINTRGNELFPFVDPAGNLYYASTGNPGLGGLDIFYSVLTNGGRQSNGAIEHLAAPINSPQDDFGIITDADRSGGYFSSNRRAENDDIYRFVRESSLYGCRNLTLRIYDTDTDAPLDSAMVEIKTRGEGRISQQAMTDAQGLIRLCLEGQNDFVFQAERDGYVTSTAGFSTRALTDDQPSRFEMGLTHPTIIIDTIIVPVTEQEPLVPLKTSQIQGIIKSERDQRPIEGVLVRLKNECDGSFLQTITGPDGKYVFQLKQGCDYTIMASKPDYGINTKRIKRLPRKAKPKELSADIRMFTVGDVIRIDNIYYDLGLYTLRADASRELDKLVATMRKNPSLVIEIRSHTDSRGEANTNKELSTRRAKAVANYLISKGIAQRRIVANGYGESQLLNNCTDGVICTEAEHQRNRRTEFKVLSVK